MARIRSIKPEVRTDLTLASWPRELRYAYVLLWGYCDDQGRGIDDLRLLTSDLFPLDRDITERKLNSWIQRMADSGRICRYETEGHHFLHVIKWHHQRINRPTPSRLPPCPTHGGLDQRDEVIRSMSDSRSDSVNDSRSRSLNGSVNGSVSDSPPSRAPAEQGAGKGAGKGAGSREHVSREAPTAPDVVSASPQQLPKNHPGVTHPSRVLNLLDKTGPWIAAVRGQLATQVDALVTEGVTDDVITAALDTWRTESASGGAGPGLLPHLAQRHLAGGASTSTGPKSRAAKTLELAARLEAAEQGATG